MVETDIRSGYIDDVRNVFEAAESPVGQGEQVATLTADVLAEDGWLDDELDSFGGDPFQLGMLYTADGGVLEASITPMVA